MWRTGPVMAFENADPGLIPGDYICKSTRQLQLWQHLPGAIGGKALVLSQSLPFPVQLVKSTLVGTCRGSETEKCQGVYLPLDIRTRQTHRCIMQLNAHSINRFKGSGCLILF